MGIPLHCPWPGPVPGASQWTATVNWILGGLTSEAALLLRDPASVCSPSGKCSLESLLLCCNCSKLIEELITQCTKKPIKVWEAATPTAPPEESNLKEGSFWVWVTWLTLYATDELSLLISRDRWGSESAPPAHEQGQVSQRGWPDLPSPWAPWREDSGVHAKSLLLFPTLYYAMDCSPPGSLVKGFSRQDYWSGLPCPPPGESSRPRDQTCVSCISCIGFFTTNATWEAWEDPVPPNQILSLETIRP